jgi:transcription initiation factor IIE alpha subunit
MEKSVVTFRWSLDTTCPHCGEDIDLSDNDAENEYYLSKKIFSNKWPDVEDEEVTCPLCGNDFLIESVEV